LTGKERYVRKSAKTYREAGVELTKLQAQVDDHRHPRSAVTVGYIIDRWLEVTQLEDTTRQRYEGLIRRYVQPTFGSMGAGKLDAELLASMPVLDAATSSAEGEQGITRAGRLPDRQCGKFISSSARSTARCAGDTSG
jgi:hypothetical protein